MAEINSLLLGIKTKGAGKAASDLKKVGKSAKSAGADFKRGSASASSMGAALKGPLAAGLGVAVIGLAAAAAALVVFKKIVKATLTETLKLAEDLDTITKKAQSIGATNRDLQLVTNAFSLFGVEAEQTQKSMQRLNQSMGEAMLPDAPKTLLDAFERLGVGAAELSQMPLADRLIAISAAFESYSGQATRATDANKLFGRTGKDALVAFGQGAQAMRDAIGDIERYGIASDESFKAAEDLLDAQLRLSLALKYFRTEALTPLMQVLSGTAQAVADMLAAMDSKKVKLFALDLAILGQSAIKSMMGLGLFVDNLIAYVGVAVDAFQTLFAMKRWDIQGTQKNFGELSKGLSGLNRELLENQQYWTDLAGGIDRAINDAVISALGAADKIEKEAPSGGPGKGNGNGNGKGDDGTEDRLKKHLDDYRAYYAELQQLQLEAFLSEQEQIRMLEEQRRQYLAISLDATRAGITAISDLAGSVSSMVSALYGQNSLEAKRAAKAAFVVQKAAAIAEATISMAVAIAKANELGYPASIPAMIAAGITGGTQIAAIVATTIAGVADAGLPPDALRQAGLSNHTVLAIRKDEMVLDPKGTQAITEMLQARQYGGGSQPVVVNTRLELDGRVLGETVDDHLVRSSERGLNYQSRIRYGRAS